MIVKQTTATPGVWKPSVSDKARQLAGSCEVTALKLCAGGGAAAVAFYNGTSAADVKPFNLVWFLDASTTDVDSDIFVNPLNFDKGVYAVCEQGWAYDPIVCISRFGT